MIAKMKKKKYSGSGARGGIASSSSTHCRACITPVDLHDHARSFAAIVDVIPASYYLSDAAGRGSISTRFMKSSARADAKAHIKVSAPTPPTPAQTIRFSITLS